MRKIIFCLLFLSFLGGLHARNENVTISGTVTDFHGNALEGVSVILKDKQFRPLYETLSGKDGTYSLSVPKGTYYCLYAIKLSEYRVTKLEYWTWNVPVYEDMEINPQYDRMEIYGINVFEPQVTPQETYMVYFRPMSLTKTLDIADERNVDNKKFEQAEKTEELLKTTDEKILNMSPDSITPEELTIEVNDVKAEIVGINKMTEYARGIYLNGYAVQILKPQNSTISGKAYDKISITLHSFETDEFGKGEAFIKRN